MAQLFGHVYDANNDSRTNQENPNSRYYMYALLHRCRDDPLIVDLKDLRHFNNYCLATSIMTT